MKYRNVKTRSVSVATTIIFTLPPPLGADHLMYSVLS